MRSLRPFVLAALALALPACGRSSSTAASPAAGSGSLATPAAAAAPAPRDTGPTAALWALAPAGTTIGIVVDGDALASMAQRGHAMLALRSTVSSEASPWERLLEAATVGIPLDQLASCGVDLHAGLAIFGTTDAQITIMPVVDRARFVTCRHGHRDGDVDHMTDMTCGPQRGHYVCGAGRTAPGELGGAAAAIRGTWPSTPGNHVEVWISREALSMIAGSGTQAVFEPTGDLRGAFGMTPGEMTARFHVDGRWRGPLAPVVRDLAHVDAAGASSFVAVGGATLVHLIADQVPPVPLAKGLNARDLVHALNGDLGLRVPAGTSTAEFRVGLASPDVVAELIGHCDELSGLVRVEPRPPAGHCRVVIPLDDRRLRLDGRIEGHDLRITASWDGATGATADVPSTTTAHELADGTWTIAAWGRGNLIGAPWRALGAPPGKRAQLALLEEIAEVGIGLRMGTDGATFLLHVRSRDADPDAVVHAVTPLIAASIHGEDVTARADAVAARFPHSRFAADRRAGWAGLGVLAMVAVAVMSATDEGP